jgi:hypothetical protein
MIERAPHILYSENKPKPVKIDRRRKQRLNVYELTAKIRELTDQAMIFSGDARLNRAALRNLRRLLKEYPNAMGRSHIRHNLGRLHTEWITAVALRENE